MADSDHTLGAFKPVGHVVISLPSAEQADAAAHALASEGVQGDALRRYTDQEMLRQIEHDLKHASPIAAIGQELNLVKSHEALARRGYHWLVVRADGDEHAQRIAAIAQQHGAERAQHYGRFVIEELIEHPDDEPRVTESPDKGLDAQTTTGLEVERAVRRPPESDKD